MTHMTYMTRHALIRRLTELWHGDPWYGSSSDAILAGIAARDAARSVDARTHTIWQLVLHMTAWTTEVTARLGGARAGTPAVGDWPRIPAAASMPDSAAAQEAWTETLASLAEARRALISAIESATDEDWVRPVVRGDGESASLRSRAETTSGLADHDIYHLGQIAHIKRAIPS